MRTGRTKQRLILTDEEHDRLESLAHRARSQPALARRARVLLACAEGQQNPLSLGKDSPEPRGIQPPEMGSVVALPQVGGLHHRYERRVA